MDNKNGLQFGLQFLNDGEYEVKGGLGNQTLAEVKIENGILYIKENGEFTEKEVPSFSDFINNKSV